jgi:hypothetical protein
LDEFRQCCILGGCDYFEVEAGRVAACHYTVLGLQGVQRGTVSWLNSWLAPTSLLFAVFRELLTKKKKKKISENVGESVVVKNYLLADAAAFQMPAGGEAAFLPTEKPSEKPTERKEPSN